MSTNNLLTISDCAVMAAGVSAGPAFSRWYRVITEAHRAGEFVPTVLPSTSKPMFAEGAVLKWFEQKGVVPHADVVRFKDGYRVTRLPKAATLTAAE